VAVGPVQLLVVGFSHPGKVGGLIGLGAAGSECISPLDLIAMGLVDATEAEALASSEGDAL
jgi:hypothetical protein